MKIKWFNVSSFLITTDSGVRIITDPYFHAYNPPDPPPGWNSNRPAVAEYADVVTITHYHSDHSFPCAIKGVPRLYLGGPSVEIKGVKFNGVATLHDNYGEYGGPLPVPTRGLNNIIGIEADGLRILHMGDYGLQEKMYDEQLAQIGKADILMTPWGDFIPGILSQLNPKVVLPMHHTTVDQVKDMPGFTDLTGKTSSVEFTANTIPREMKVIMLKPSLEY